MSPGELDAVERFIRRTRWWAGTAVGLCAAMFAIASWVWAQGSASIARRMDRADERAVRDSVRSERQTIVLELAVIAVVDPDSDDRTDAVKRLRNLRRVMPR